MLNSISLAYILKNEEEYIERSVLSVAQAVDELVVVDTGSTDSTVRICERLGADIYHFTWNDDFSSARNFLLSKCKMKWILMMDADEHFEGEKIDAFRRAVDQADQESIVAYQMIRKNHYPSHDYDSPFFSYPFYPDMQTRLFRKMDQIFFSGRVHEGVVQSINTSGIGGIGRIPVCIHHHMFRGNQNKYEEEKKNMYDRLSQMDGGHK